QFIYLQAGGGLVSETFTVSWERARRILGGLQRLKILPGDKLILYLRNYQDFVPTMWACFLGGVIPAPLVSNQWSRHDAHAVPLVFDRLHAVLDGPRIVTDSRGLSNRKALGRHAGGTLLLENLEAEPPSDAFF